jgi:hypothetical protein
VNALAFIDPSGLDWRFVGWRQEWKKTWWTHWRWTIALCENKCGDKIKEVYAIYEQWRPIPINTPELGTLGDSMSKGPAAGGSAAGSFFDLFEAMREARERGSRDYGDIYWESWKEMGQQFCDTLNE